MSSVAGQPHVDRKQYLKIFGLLTLLTAIEVGIAYITQMDRTILVVLLIGLALVKAFYVGWYFMHLGHESKHLKGTVVLPFLFPAVYAMVLITEAAWRFAHGVASQ